MNHPDGNGASPSGAGEKAFYALLVGINEYLSPNVSRLRGCVNDVKTMQQTLQNRFGVPEQNIVVLTDAQATHQAIKDKFHDHLIGHAKAWDAAGRPGEPPAFLFHYSGHGSQAFDPTGTEPDGKDETLVPYDSRTPGVYDIKDWEMGQMVEELSKYSDNLTILLDSCHSGSGLRNLDEQMALTRQIPADMRPQPTGRSPQKASTRSLAGASNWLEGGRYVLLSGCRDRELSNEYLPSEGAQREWQGALSFFVLRELNAMPAGQPLKYRELHSRVRHAVHAIYPQQTPQCEGDLEREVFGGLRAEAELLFDVVDKSEGMIWISGGLVHGLTKGSLLNVYPEGTNRIRDAQPVARLEIEDARATRSGCLPPAGVDVPLHSRAAIDSINLGNLRRKVALAIADPNLLRSVQARLQQPDAAPYLEVGLEGAQLQVAEVDGTLQIQDLAGTPLTASFPIDQHPQETMLNDLAGDLKHIVRYLNTLELHNPSPDSELTGMLQLSLKWLAFDPATQTPLAGEDVPLQPGGERIVETGQAVVLEITNNADRPVYFSVFDLPYDWGVYQIYPQVQGAHEALASGKTFTLGLDPRPNRQLRAGLPDKEVQEAREIFKVIATAEDTDFEILRQGGLRSPYQKRGVSTRSDRGKASPLELLLQQAVQGGNQTRHFGGSATTVEDDWTTASLEVRVVRPPQEGAASLDQGQTSNLRGYPISIEAPAGFSGKARILTQLEGTRATGLAAGLGSPPGLAAHPDLFQPLSLRSTRASNPEGLVIEIQADDLARAAISPDNPLRIHLEGAATRDVEHAAGVLAVAFDGEFYHLVGRSGPEPDTIDIEWLPEPEPEEERPGQRSLGRTAKLYLFKVLGWKEPSLGLHKARFVPAERLDQDSPLPGERSYPSQGGEARYRLLQNGDLQAGQRVALFVHGFTSDTHWMVSGPAAGFQEKSLYDHYLTFNYETFNTPVAENAQNLANLLQAAGFGPQDGLHLDIYAHSMGTLVTRTMIELFGGDEFTDRAFLAGPPNLGTPLAEAKRIIPWVGALLLNNLTPSPPTLIASWALKKISAEAVSAEDLLPKSSLLKQLNGSTKPARVHYHILAGRNLIQPSQEAGLKRLAQKAAQGLDTALDFIFSDQNDLVIAVSSMSTVRGGEYPASLLSVQVVPCDHFGYFNTPEARERMAAWLTPPAPVLAAAEAAAPTAPPKKSPASPRRSRKPAEPI